MRNNNTNICSVLNLNHKQDKKCLIEKKKFPSKTSFRILHIS